MSVEDHHAEVRAIIESGLTKLQEWLEVRLQQQDELLRCISHDCRLQSNPEAMIAAQSRSQSEPEAYPEAPQFKWRSTPEAPSSAAIEENGKKGALAGSKLEAPTTASDHCPSYAVSILELPGVVSESYADSQISPPHVAAASSESTSANRKHQRDTSPDPHCSSSPDARLTHLGRDWQTELMSVFDQLDLDGSGDISYSELMQAFAEAQMPDLKAFRVFMNTSAKGSINRDDWLNLIQEVTKSSDDEIKLLVAFLDRLRESTTVSRATIRRGRSGKTPCLILRHDSPWRMAWDLGLCVLLFYVSISVPFSLGFDAKGLEPVDMVVDLIFCCDVVLNFRTSYMDDVGIVVLDGRLIAMKYLKSWFTLDFVSSVPFDLITNGLLPNLTPARLIKIGKITKVMKLLRISKAMSVATESELMESVEQFLTSSAFQTFARLAQLVAMMFIAAHWLACFGSAIDKEQIRVYFSGELEEPSELKKYLAGMYWSMTTLSTVGYGDITPKTDEERAYAIVAMVTGGALYGYVIGSLTSIVTETGVSSRAYNERMELIYCWLDGHEQLPAPLRRRLRRFFKRTQGEKSVLEDSQIIADLSPELGAETARYLINEHVKRHPMFCDFPYSALTLLVQVLHTKRVNAHEYVVKWGDPGTAMYILVEGLAKYEQGALWTPAAKMGPSGDERFQLVSHGDSFGEEVLFSLEQEYRYTVVALKECEFQVLDKVAFYKTYNQRFPQLHKQMFEAFLKSR